MSHVQITTETKNFHKYTLSTLNVTSQTARIATQTKPAGTANSSVLFGASLNYLKLKFYCGTANLNNLYVYGWNWCTELNGWVPQLLATVTPTMAASTQSLPTVGTVYEVTNFVKTTGDCKIYQGQTTTTNGGFLLVDTLGSEYIEIAGTVSSGSGDLVVLAAGL